MSREKFMSREELLMSSYKLKTRHLMQTASRIWFYWHLIEDEDDGKIRESPHKVPTMEPIFNERHQMRAWTRANILIAINGHPGKVRQLIGSFSENTKNRQYD
jgi:hypothetical protein